MEVDIFDGASDAASGAFTEGSWGDRSDRDLYQVLEDPLLPDQSLPDFERQVLRASATLTLRSRGVAPGVVERALMGARIQNAARNDPRGAIAHLEDRLAGELEVPSESTAVVEILVNMLQAERQAQGSPSRLRALMAPLPRGTPVSPPPRRLFGTGGHAGGELPDQAEDRQGTPELGTPPGLGATAGQAR